MSTTLPVPSLSIPTTRRSRLLATASAAVAAGAVAVTLAVSAGGGEAPGATVAPAGGTPATAQPDAAKIYHHSIGSQEPSGQEAGRRAAERFHHFR